MQTQNNVETGRDLRRAAALGPQAEKKKTEARFKSSRTLLPETIELLFKKWEIANNNGGRVVQQKHIIHRAVELISDDELRRLRDKLATPKHQVQDSFRRWQGGDGKKTMDDFLAHLVSKLDMNNIEGRAKEVGAER
jgi:hypothetical protein